MKLCYRTYISLLSILAVTALVACGRQAESLTHEQFLAFGTLVEISLYGVDQPLADQAIAAVESNFQRMHKQWHAWHPSLLTDLNHGIAAGKSTVLDEELLTLITVARSLSLQSDGLFNPAIGQLIRLWGFQQDDFTATQPPDSAAIRGILSKQPSMKDLIISKDSVRSSNPAVQLDLGAIAKGYGIDLVIEQLRSMGIANAIVNCGGDLRVIGSHGHRPWRIGIRNPRGAGILASLELGNDESIFTSGDYERFFESNGERYHHILDPRTGYPARGATSVTVVHQEGVIADAAATALFVAGPDAWQSIAQRMGIRYAMLVDQGGIVHLTPAMADRVQFEVDPLPTTEISEP